MVSIWMLAVYIFCIVYVWSSFTKQKMLQDAGQMQPLLKATAS